MKNIFIWIGLIFCLIFTSCEKKDTEKLTICVYAHQVIDSEKIQYLGYHTDNGKFIVFESSNMSVFDEFSKLNGVDSVYYYVDVYSSDKAHYYLAEDWEDRQTDKHAAIAICLTLMLIIIISFIIVCISNN